MNLHVTIQGDDCPRTFKLSGRLGWTMAQLAYAGTNGVETVARPAPRWSAYVYDLRKMGIPIGTEMVEHGGKYPGRHARYTLNCEATLSDHEGSSE